MMRSGQHPVIEQSKDANSKAALAAKQRTLSFLTMSADETFFKVSGTGLILLFIFLLPFSSLPLCLWYLCLLT